VKKKAGRPRKDTLPSSDDVEDAFSSAAYYGTNGYDRPRALYDSPPDVNSTPRLRLRLRKPEPPNRHPHHAAPPPKYPSFAEWLQADDPLEGEEGHRITQEKAEEEAQRRMRIVEAAETGVLSQARCSIFNPEPAEEPPPQYGHWDHVVAHTLHFTKLLKEESAYHRRMAKTVAKEALDYWKEKYKRKTQEEIDQEETDRAVLRYKQLVKDVKDSWANVRIEIDKERVAKWEEEQLQLGHKAMDDMFNQAQEILGRGVMDSASSFVSEDREFDEDEEGSIGTTAFNEEAEEHDEIMSSSSDSDEANGKDEDEHLTAEQLQAKYGQLPDLPQLSSDDEDDSIAERREDEDADRTPEPTPDRDLEMEDVEERADPAFTTTNGFHSDEGSRAGGTPSLIDPSKVELDNVDEALLDSEDEDGRSDSGSEEWSSDEESEEEEASQSDSEDGEGAGVMGFLAPEEIEKMKAAAKSSTTHGDTEAKSSLVNGHAGQGHDPMEEDEATPNINGKSEVPDEPVEDHIIPNATEGQATPTIEVEESAAPEEPALEQSLSRSRSRHTSSPPRTEIPPLLRGTLREYQHDGLDWLANLYDSQTNGILADEMGLGKTIQTISLLAHIAVQREIWGPHLVVVPTSVMLNWEMEFKKWCPGFKILTYYGDINERKRKRTGWRNPGRDMYNVVITSYQLILQDAAAFKMRAWKYLILDEAHNIKNFKSQRWQTMLNLRTDRRLLLTGTPLQNNIDELWSLLYFLMPAGFAGEGRIAGLEEFTMALKNPTSQILEQGRQQLDAEAQKIVKKLHEVLRPYLLRRLKADVEKQMPGKYEHVVYCKLSKRQRQLYDGFMGRASTKEILSSGNYMSIINCLMSLRKVCNHPDLFETRAIVTSMAMPKSVAADFEIKDLLVRKRLRENAASEVNLDALNLVFAHREHNTKFHARRTQQIRATRPLEDLIERQTRRLTSVTSDSAPSLAAIRSAIVERENLAVRDQLQTCLNLTRARTDFLPLYGKDLIDRVSMDYNDFALGAHYQKEYDYEPENENPLHPLLEYEAVPLYTDCAMLKKRSKGRLGFRAPRQWDLAGEWGVRQLPTLLALVPTLEQRAEMLEPIITRFSCVTPAVVAEDVAPLTLSKRGVQLIRSSPMAHSRDPFHESRVRLSIAFPDKRLLQYDCGKLQRLASLLRDLQAGGHRALIFTQMTKVLDILEQFLNIHGHRYLRLDGATKVEQRQILTDRFNTDPRILCFILSSRSGGLGINLTGADTVIFYDLDWNPAMDKQCQDRSHRIGQTRDVHIYKFVSEYTIEANILRKSNQKRLLDDVIIQKGDFTTDMFNKVTWRDALEVEEPVDEAGAAMDRVLGEKAGILGDAKVMRSVEDTEDLNAANVAEKEIVDEIHDDQVDFNESTSATPANAATRQTSEAINEANRIDDADRRHVDEYMLDLYREEYGKEPYRPPTDRQKRNRKGGDMHRTHKKKRY
jgi:helicase SWR1